MEFIKDDLTAYALHILLLSGHQQIFARKTADKKGRCFTQVVTSSRFKPVPDNKIKNTSTTISLGLLHGIGYSTTASSCQQRDGLCLYLSIAKRLIAQ